MLCAGLYREFAMFALIQRCRCLLPAMIVVFGLFVSAVTIWPAVPELKMAVRLVWGEGAAQGVLHGQLAAQAQDLHADGGLVAAAHSLASLGCGQ